MRIAMISKTNDQRDNPQKNRPNKASPSKRNKEIVVAERNAHDGEQ